MFCSGRHAAFVLVFLLIFSNCRRETPSNQRLAILRFENLSGDESLDWMGRAAPEIMTEELRDSRALQVVDPGELHAVVRNLGPGPVSAPGISAEQPAALLAGANRILYGRISRVANNLRLNAVLFDGPRGKIEREFTAAGPESQGVIPLADSLAHDLAASATPAGTRSERALREYCNAEESPDANAAEAAFARAVEADANFGQAYVAWAQLAAGQNDRAQAERVLSVAASRGNALPERQRARIVALSAELHGDRKGAVQALETEARLDPSNAGLLRRLAQAHLGAHQYQEAVLALKKAAGVQPENPELWNDLGYAEMFVGDLQAAAKALDEYRRIRPTDPNALDSLGDVHFYLGQFPDAEKYYRQAFEMDNNFNGASAMLKAAHAHLRTGDISGADKLFDQYLDVRQKAGDPLLELRHAEWEFVTGRKPQAMNRLETQYRRLAPRVGQEMMAQLAVWELQTGNRKRAVESAQAARGSPSGSLISFLTEAPAQPDEWKKRALELLPKPSEERTRNVLISYALLLQGEFSAAVPVLADVYQNAPPIPAETLPVLLAWAEIETGRVDDATPLVQRNPIPSSTPDLFASLAFPRLLQFQALVAEKQGKQGEAATARRLFATLSGPGAAITLDGTR